MTRFFTMPPLLSIMATAMLSIALLTGCSSLSGAGLNGIPGPAVVADQTIADEKAAIAAEEAYQALVFLGNTALDFGLVSPETAPKIAVIDSKVFASLKAGRALYRAGNADGLIEAKRAADEAIVEIANLIKGGSS